MVIVGHGSAFLVVVVDSYFSVLVVGWFFVFSIWWCFSGSGDGWVLVVWLSFNRWLLAVVGLLDLVVVAGCVGLIYGGRESEIGEMREIFFFFLG